MSEGLVAGSFVILLLIIFLILFLAEYQKGRKKHLEEKLKLQEELLRTRIEIQEQTLKNISQEIHDNIGQTLSLAKLNLNTIDIQKQNGLPEKIYSSKELVSKAIHDLRNLSRSLNTDSILAAGLLKAIETELSIVRQAGVFKTEMIITGTALRIDAKKELILFRIIQEAINNIIKHSDAKNINLYVSFDDDLQIQIHDDGKGFARNETVEGSGLRNMQSRAQLIGGAFTIQSSSEGTIITVTFQLLNHESKNCPRR